MRASSSQYVVRTPSASMAPASLPSPPPLALAATATATAAAAAPGTTASLQLPTWFPSPDDATPPRHSNDEDGDEDDGGRSASASLRLRLHAAEQALMALQQRVHARARHTAALLARFPCLTPAQRQLCDVDVLLEPTLSRDDVLRQMQRSARDATRTTTTTTTFAAHTLRSHDDQHDHENDKDDKSDGSESNDVYDGEVQTVCATAQLRIDEAVLQLVERTLLATRHDNDNDGNDDVVALTCSARARQECNNMSNNSKADTTAHDEARTYAAAQSSLRQLLAQPQQPQSTPSAQRAMPQSLTAVTRAAEATTAAAAAQQLQQQQTHAVSEHMDSSDMHDNMATTTSAAAATTTTTVWPWVSPAHAAAVTGALTIATRRGVVSDDEGSVGAPSPLSRAPPPLRSGGGGGFDEATARLLASSPQPPCSYNNDDEGGEGGFEM